MIHFVMTMKLTDSGRRGIEKLPLLCDEIRSRWKELGGELEVLYVTMGAFDLLAAGSLPSEMAAMAMAGSISSGGSVTTVTAPAMTIEEFKLAGADYPTFFGITEPLG